MRQKSFCVLLVAVIVLGLYLWLGPLPTFPDWFYPWTLQGNKAGHQSLSEAVWSQNRGVRR